MTFSVENELSLLTDDDMRMAVETRIQKVRDHQMQEFRMQPRDDSQLTWAYAIGLEERDPFFVAQELAIVDSIHRQTRYAAIIEEVMRGVAYHMKTKYRLGWDDTWDIVRFYVPSMLKFYCARDLFRDRTESL